MWSLSLKDKKYKTENYYGRFSLDGQQYEFTSKTSNKKNAIKILSDKFEEIKVLKKTGNLVKSKDLVIVGKNIHKIKTRNL